MAVYTEVSSDALESFLADYDVGTLVSVKGIAEGVENTNYLVDTTGGRFILTLYEKRVRAEDLPFFLGLMGHLASRGINCPQPVPSRAGSTLGEISGRLAALVTFLDGVSVRRPHSKHCVEVGAAMAHLHDAGEGFELRRGNALGVDGWRPLFERFAATADEVSPGLFDLVSTELARLEPEWPRSLPAGVIHADLFPDNVFFLDGRLSGIIDFYFACNDAYAYDLAVALNAWCFEPDLSFNVTKARALLAGYGSVRPLSPAERSAIPTLARGAALRFLLTRAYDWLNTPKDALVRPHDPLEYVRRLRFHQSAADAASYGLGAP